jgi:hypothetical protein
MDAWFGMFYFVNNGNFQLNFQQEGVDEKEYAVYIQSKVQVGLEEIIKGIVLCKKKF